MLCVCVCVYSERKSRIPGLRDNTRDVTRAGLEGEQQKGKMIRLYFNFKNINV